MRCEIVLTQQKKLFFLFFALHVLLLHYANQWPFLNSISNIFNQTPSTEHTIWWNYVYVHTYNSITEGKFHTLADVTMIFYQLYFVVFYRCSSGRPSLKDIVHKVIWKPVYIHFIHWRFYKMCFQNVGRVPTWWTWWWTLQKFSKLKILVNCSLLKTNVLHIVYVTFDSCLLLFEMS